MMASDDNLVPRKEATSILLKWFGYKKSDLWAQYKRILFLTKIETTSFTTQIKNRPSSTTSVCKKAHKEQVLTAGSV